MINKQKGNCSENDKKEYILASKEINYYTILLSLIESIYKREEKLKTNFLKNLSATILQYTLTDDLEISAMIHGLIINFTQSFKRIISYFNDFVEFFLKTSNSNIGKVNQISTINYIIQTINIIINRDISQNVAIIIEGTNHFNLFDMILFWLNSFLEGNTSKRENILFVLIKTIKNASFLSVLKIIYLAIFKFLIDKSEILKNTNDVISESISFINPNTFKIECLYLESKEKVLENLNLQCKEDNKVYNFTAENLYKLQSLIFRLINKCEKKIVLFSKFSEDEFLQRRINLTFFNNRYITLNESEIITEYVRYYKCWFEDIKVKFFQLDLIQNLSNVNSLYQEFKERMDETNLMRFCFLLYKTGKILEACILLQYSKKLDYDLAFNLLKKDYMNFTTNNLEYIFKITFFELLAHLYYENGKNEHLKVIKSMILRTSNHQIFKKHALRKHFKIINFIKFIENLQALSF